MEETKVTKSAPGVFTRETLIKLLRAANQLGLQGKIVTAMHVKPGPNGVEEVSFDWTTAPEIKKEFRKSRLEIVPR